LLEKKFQVQEPGNVQNEMTGQTNKKDTWGEWSAKVV
jgi:hypothetical protein